MARDRPGGDRKHLQSGGNSRRRGRLWSGEFILGPARKEVQLRAFSPSRDLIEIKEATLGLNSGVIGAVVLARGADGEYLLGSTPSVWPERDKMAE